ncbi:MAG: N-6 DNA methylase, partial [Candidatus Delongbacteria bacterium]|nr:N-6 DNA methylase [Candidatus Delongbacteria bacterium]
MSNLFQRPVEAKFITDLNKDILEEKYEIFSNHFLDSEIQKNIRNLNEEQYQGEFLDDLFVKVFGYKKNPTPNFNLTTEYKNVKDAKKADGAILINGKAVAVIELKGTDTTDLGKVESQAFGYKNNQPDCKYIITSNFEKLRFYIENTVSYDEFDLFNLTKERFALLYLCLSRFSIENDIPLKVKKASIVEEEQITKKLYKDYSNFKHDVYRNIIILNPEYDKLLLFKKSQKLLDRFLFIFFAEDKQLLPPNSTLDIINKWKDLKDKYDAYIPLIDRFRKYFNYLNTGEKEDIFAYNGGLFAPDEILDTIKIDDEMLYKHAKKLSDYDFATEVDVNILGHIFEHSLNELEELQAELEGKEIDKKNTKRKKDGVFYTPKHITKYIVENTVGKLCEEKKVEFDIKDEDFVSSKQLKTRKVLLDKLNKYRDWLLHITICDPACGSGAFLNQALEFLIKEHAYIDELTTKLSGGTLVIPQDENDILEHNLYGVDINEESVEIAKLSLWLRTARKGRKLSTLSNNIKCGNSLIDDPEVAGDKAFNWQKEFPHIFGKKDIKIVDIELEHTPDYLNMIELNAKLAKNKAEESVK